MRQIFVNLPVKDLPKSRTFFEGLGFPVNPTFTDDKAACLVIEKDVIHAMLITEPYFRTFTPKPISDAKKSTEVLIALSCSSDQEVKDLVSKALATGGKTVRDAKDHGFMLEHAFEDPDGHIWEVMHMREMPK